MAGWIRKLSTGRYQARYRAPDRRTRTKTWDRKVDAERWLRGELAKVDRGEWVDPELGKTTFGDWSKVAMEARLHTRHSTKARDRSYMKSLVLPAFGDVQLRDITAADVQAWVSRLTGDGYAPQTVRKASSLMRSVLVAAVESDLIARAPGARIRLPRLERVEMRCLTVEEFGELLEEIPERYRPLVRTAAYSGLRYGELAGLQRGSVDPLRRTLTVRRNLVEVSGNLHVEEPKTAAGRRTVAIPSWLAGELAALLATHDSDEVFTAPMGGPLRRGNFRSRVWKPATDRAGFEGFRFHDLRHTHAAWLIAQGEHVKLIQIRLGHASIKTTMDTYGHLLEGLDEAAAEALPPPIAHHTRAEVIEIPRNVNDSEGF